MRVSTDQYVHVELLWLEDEAEARSEQTSVTKLWERFAAGRTASPFGVILRPAPGSEPVCPWHHPTQGRIHLCRPTRRSQFSACNFAADHTFRYWVLTAWFSS